MLTPPDYILASQVKGVARVDKQSVGHGIYPLIEGLKRHLLNTSVGHKELDPYLECRKHINWCRHKHDVLLTTNVLNICLKDNPAY